MKKKKIKGSTIVQYLILIFFAMIMFFPIYWIFSNSLKTLTGISEFPPEFFPSDPQWGNYLEILRDGDTLIYFRNTLIILIGNTVGTLISSSLVAYPLARLEFRGKKTIFAVILATMMVPSATLIIPQFLLFRKFGWLDSFLPLIVPSFFAQPYNVFLFRQFFMTVPKSLDESAKLDGCNRIQIFTKILAPVAKPIFITVGVLSAVFWWNELFSPLIFIDSEKLKPLTVGALSAFTIQGTGNMTIWNQQMAFATLMSIPPMILYMFASKYLVEGIKTSGEKG